MKKRDSHLIKASSNYDQMEKTDGVSRWSELSQCIDFHTKMAERCWIPTKYWLVNEPEGNLPKRFNVAWGERVNFKKESENAIKIVKCIRNQLNAHVIPLARQMKKIQSFLSREASRLKKSNQYVGVVICTQGEPTDAKGKTGVDALKDFTESFSSLSNLPVKIIVRLCTDNDVLINFYNTLDIHEKCDVLDDFWGEVSAMFLIWKILSAIMQRLSPPLLFCVQSMEVYLHNPWLTYGIGIHRLREACLGTELMDDLDETSLSLDEIHEFCLEFFTGKNHDVPLCNPLHDFSEFLSDLRNILKSEKLVWNPVKNKLCPWIDVDKLDKLFRKEAENGRTGKRESYCRVPPPQNGIGGKMNFKCTQAFKPLHKAPPQASPSNTKNLDDAIRRWSTRNGSETIRLDELLVDMPKLFPISNNHVEDHEYFDKWNEFSADAFKEENPEAKKELVRRAARKAQRFCQDDQLPADMTENQKTLFKSIGNVLSKSLYREEKRIDLNNFSKTNF